MSNQSPLKVTDSNVTVPVKIAEEAKEGDLNGDLAKVTVVPKKSKYPAMNVGFLAGFVGTILIGSFHYGSLE